MKKNTKVGLFKTLRADLNRKKSGKKRMGSVYNFESDASEMVNIRKYAAVYVTSVKWLMLLNLNNKINILMPWAQLFKTNEVVS